MSEKKYKLKVLTPAQNELEEIALVHLGLAGPLSARKITNRIYGSMELLKTAPNMGVSCTDKQLQLKGYRMLICGNYLCIYRPSTLGNLLCRQRYGK